jgi:putative transposase
MKLIDKQQTDDPVKFGQLKIIQFIEDKLKIKVNRKRIQRLMRIMNVEGEYQKKRTTIPSKNHKIYPYLLTHLDITHSNQVWSTDITYIPMRKGYMYLVAIIDWFSRYVVAWSISNTMEINFCIDTLNEALKLGKPIIFNSDQGSQFTSNSFTSILEKHNIQISMDSKGRWKDNIIIERLWRTVKYENIYKYSYENGSELNSGLNKYFNYYNKIRYHQSLNNLTPEKFHFKYLTKNKVTSNLIIAQK